MFGAHILSLQEGKLAFTPQPAIPEYLIPDDGHISATLFGDVEVNYHFAQRKDYIPGEYEIQSMIFAYHDVHITECGRPFAAGSVPEDLRSGKISSVQINIS